MAGLVEGNQRLEGNHQVPRWEEGAPLSIGICSADFEEYSSDVATKLAAALPNLGEGVSIGSVSTEAYDLPSGTPTLDRLVRHHVLLVWTASWTIAGGRNTRYDRSATGTVLQQYVEAGGNLVQCYGNRPPGGDWERRDGGRSVGEWQGIELAQGVPANTPVRVASSGVAGGAGGPVDRLLRTLRVGGSMWVNTTATRPGARVIARWPAGVGLDTPSPSDFITVRDTNNNGSGREGGGGGGRGGRVILLNLYPPSQDAGNASGAIRTMWNASFTDMAPAFAACIFLAASPLPVLAEEQGDGEEDGEEAEVAIAFEDFDDVVDAIIHVINTQGVPLWNSGDYAGCARAYHAVATHFAPGERLLAEALAAAEGQPEDESFESQGWILRRALDAVVDRSRSAETLLARERRAAAALEAEAAARGLTIEAYAQLLEDQRAAKEAEDEKRRGEFREELEERNAATSPVPKEVAVEKELTAVLARPMLTRQLSNRSRQVLKTALTEVPPQYLCPITYEVMKEPVVCADGHTYEQEAIEEWLRHHDTSPVTNAVLPIKQTFPNYSLRSAIRDFVARAESVEATVDHQDEQLDLLKRAMGYVQKAVLKAILGGEGAGGGGAASPTSVDDLMKHENAVRQAFAIFDTNSDGVLDAAEFKALFQQQQQQQQQEEEEAGGGGEKEAAAKEGSFSDEEVREIMTMIDIDENGTIEVEEFLEWLFGKGQWQKSKDS